MANTFKVKTKAGVTTLATVYTVPTTPATTIILGLILGNTTASGITATVTLSSNTDDTEVNADVELVTNAPIPAQGSLEILSGSKVVMQTTDILKVTATGACDVALSILEMT